MTIQSTDFLTWVIQGIGLGTLVILMFSAIKFLSWCLKLVTTSTIVDDVEINS